MSSIASSSTSQTFVLFFTIIALVESAAALSFLPAYRNHWKSWKNVDWQAELPWMYPPYWLSGVVWFPIHMINSLAISFVLQENTTDDNYGAYVACLVLWTLALFLWCLWAIPFEMETVWWTALDFLVVGVLITGAAISSYSVSSISCTFMSMYAVLLFAIAVPNCSGLALRLLNDKHAINAFGRGGCATLHRRFWNPVYLFFVVNESWPPVSDVTANTAAHEYLTVMLPPPEE